MEGSNGFEPLPPGPQPGALPLELQPHRKIDWRTERVPTPQRRSFTGPDLQSGAANQLSAFCPLVAGRGAAPRSEAYETPQFTGTVARNLVLPMGFEPITPRLKAAYSSR